MFIADKDIQLLMTIFDTNLKEEIAENKRKSSITTSATKAIVHNSSSTMKKRSSNQVENYENIIDIEVWFFQLDGHLVLCWIRRN